MEPVAGFVIVIVTVAVLAIMGYRYRRRLETLQDVKRTRIAGDLHDDVAPTLASIALFAASLKQKLPSGNTELELLLEKISLFSLDAVDSLSDVVWTASPNRDSLNDLFIRMKDFAAQICTASGVAYDIDIGQVADPPVLDPELRKNLFLIFKEALTNSVRHSHASRLRIAATADDGNLRMVVEDNGKGFTIRRTPSGISVMTGFRRKTERGHGLRSMEKRAKLIEAQFSITSSPASGTKTTVTKKVF